MSWVKIDDKAWCHPKLAGLSGAAVRLWLFAMCWANQQETDGVIPRTAMRVLGGTTKAAGELVTTGLWHPQEGGWSIHDFLVYQPSRAQRNAHREATAARVKRFRDGRSNDPRDATETQHVTPLHVRSKREGNTAPDPDPDPDPGPIPDPMGSSRSDPKDLPGSARAAPPEPLRGDRGAEARRPGSLQEALELPLVARCELIERHQDDRQWVQFVEPHRWPEVVTVAEALAAAEGTKPPRLGAYHRDAGVRAVVALLAVVPVTDALVAIPRLVADPWWSEKRPGLCGLTLHQLRKAQGLRPVTARRGHNPSAVDVALARVAELEGQASRGSNETSVFDDWSPTNTIIEVEQNDAN